MKKIGKAFALRMRHGKPGGGKGPLVQTDVSGTIATGNDQTIFQDNGEEYIVRKLMPVEFERLQGFPDGWTRIAYKGKPAEKCPDAPRYKACGNSMAVPVIRYLGERIEMVNELVKEIEDERKSGSGAIAPSADD